MKNKDEQLKALELGASIDKLSKMIHSSNPGPIVIPYSLIDFSRKDVKQLTRLKLQRYLTALQLIYTNAKKTLPNIHILVGDTLQRHNFHLKDETYIRAALTEKVAQLADVLGIPLISERLLDGISAKVDYQVNGQTFQLELHTWSEYLTDDIKKIIKDLSNKMYNWINNNPNAIDQFCDNNFLFNPETGFLISEINAIKVHIKTKTGLIDDSKLDHFGQDITHSAIHFLRQKINTLDNIPLRAVPNEQLKKNKKLILTHAKMENEGLPRFINGILYLFEEVYVFSNNPALYLYGAGFVSIPTQHPLYTLHNIYQDRKQPYAIFTFADFNAVKKEIELCSESPDIRRSTPIQIINNAVQPSSLSHEEIDMFPNQPNGSASSTATFLIPENLIHLGSDTDQKSLSPSSSSSSSASTSGSSSTTVSPPSSLPTSVNSSTTVSPQSSDSEDNTAMRKRSTASEETPINLGSTDLTLSKTRSDSMNGNNTGKTTSTSNLLVFSRNILCAAKEKVGDDSTYKRVEKAVINDVLNAYIQEAETVPSYPARSRSVSPDYKANEKAKNPAQPPASSTSSAVSSQANSGSSSSLSNSTSMV